MQKLRFEFQPIFQYIMSFSNKFYEAFYYLLRYIAICCAFYLTQSRFNWLRLRLQIYYARFEAIVAPAWNKSVYLQYYAFLDESQQFNWGNLDIFKFMEIMRRFFII